jgi:uncharacterized membrane protein
MGRGKTDEYFDLPEFAFVLSAISKTSDLAITVKPTRQLVFLRALNTGLMARATNPGVAQFDGIRG